MGHSPKGQRAGWVSRPSPLTARDQVRLYNKTLETKEKANESYAALLLAKNGDGYDPELDVWRLEFQLRREGAKGFKLYAPPEEDDDEAEIEAELAAEELQHLGTLPRFFARMNELVLFLTQHWLRLVEDNGSANRSRWPTHPTWLTLREQFGAIAQAQPLDEDQRRLVRGSRYSGKNRLLRRMALGVVKSLEVEDASPTSAALLMLQRWMETVVEKEVQRITAKCQRYQSRQGFVPRWVERGMGERFSRAEQLEHRVQILLGIFSAKGVLPLEFKPAYCVGDLLTQHLDELEQEADQKGGVLQALSDHFGRIFKAAMPPSLAA